MFYFFSFFFLSPLLSLIRRANAVNRQEYTMPRPAETCFSFLSPFPFPLTADTLLVEEEDNVIRSVLEHLGRLEPPFFFLLPRFPLLLFGGVPS